MYNHLILSVLIVMVFEPSKILSRIMCISKGEYQRVSGVGIRPFRIFRFLHFLWSKCREMKKKSLKRAFQCVFLARKQEFFSFQIDTISPYYNINR